MGRPPRVEDLKVVEEIPIPGGTGAGFRVPADAYVQIVDVEGRGCADFFAFAAAAPEEYLSASHTRVAIDRLFPQVGQSFFSSLRRPLFQFVEDRTPGIHDMLFAACDPARYAQYGVPDHASCAQNLRAALRGLGVQLSHVPQPVNFFMNVGVRPDGTAVFAPPQTEAGDFVLLRAFVDCLAVISACPQEWNPATNYHPSSLLARVLRR
ncbi:MAG TPA: urea carboxylase-associated family protein [Methylomirabilota bacterium]|jgi:uncharacterized protein YcgI (DUF1989 family)|nr:urea carboxylase-associated family protein [Methylomirabilota bacterium]